MPFPPHPLQMMMMMIKIMRMSMRMMSISMIIMVMMGRLHMGSEKVLQPFTIAALGQRPISNGLAKAM